MIIKLQSLLKSNYFYISNAKQIGFKLSKYKKTFIDFVNYDYGHGFTETSVSKNNFHVVMPTLKAEENYINIFYKYIFIGHFPIL